MGGGSGVYWVLSTPKALTLELPLSLVDLFPTVITDQRSLSLEKQRAAPAQTLSFVLQ